MMSAETYFDDFFTAGGTLPSNAPSYVKRPADDELFKHIMAGEFCFVLTPRQMGKSSLMIQTAKSLADEGIKSAIVDLTQGGTTDIEDQWYKGILTQIKGRLKLSIDPVIWWEERKGIPNIQKFIEFFENCLKDIEGRIVIFIDEIDTTLKLDFRDDFFAGIRAMFNIRAQNEDFKRLSFVLLGVASPTDLISDTARTPFNIGYFVDLQEFTLKTSDTLLAGLSNSHPDHAEQILNRIFYWTNGHPYLTQKLCNVIAESKESSWKDSDVDDLVRDLFLSSQARKETNIKFILDSMLTSEDKSKLLSLYKDVLLKRVRHNGQSILQNQLKLIGVAKVYNDIIIVRNQIYKEIFNPKWVNQNFPKPAFLRELFLRLLDNPITKSLTFAIWAIPLSLLLVNQNFNFSNTDYNLLLNLTEWFSVFYGVLTVTVLVSVWKRLDNLQKEINIELENLSLLYNLMFYLDTSNNIRRHVVNEIRNYIQHEIDSFDGKETSDALDYSKTSGDKILMRLQDKLVNLPELYSKEITAKYALEIFYNIFSHRTQRYYFLRNRLPTAILIILLLTSLIWLAPIFILDFNSPTVKSFFVGGVTFVVISIMLTIIDLDDPLGGIWGVRYETWENLFQTIEQTTIK